jgi:Transposase IS116/IS110/IS902 family
LLLAFGEDRTRYQSAQDLLQYAGIAPVTERSGEKCWVHWRWGAPRFLRQTFIEWANESRKASVWAKAFYQAQKQAGKRIKLRFERWRSSGFGFCFAAGKTEFPTMKPNICLHCIRKFHR